MQVARGPPAWNQRQTTKTGGEEIKPRSKARKPRFFAAVHTSDKNAENSCEQVSIRSNFSMGYATKSNPNAQFCMKHQVEGEGAIKVKPPRGPVFRST